MVDNDEGTAPDAAIRTIARLARVFETRMQDESMSLAQYRLLAFLSDGDWAASAVAEWMAVSRPSVTGLVDGLVEKGWVVRDHSPEDRRQVLHQLTDAGRRQLDVAATALGQVLDRLFDHLDADEQRDARHGLAVLAEAQRRQRLAVKR